ncbi:hypothetical protein BH24ACT13_BH24ACT13_08390 [soil metagenome]|jgi:hypothetical protein
MPSLPARLPWKQLGDPDPAHEYLIVLTYLPVKRLYHLPRFFFYTRMVQRQLDAAPTGLAGYSMAARPFRSRYWTLTAWDDAVAVGAFISKPPHRNAMKHTTSLATFRSIRWVLPGHALPPTWGDALTRAQ